jgi:hypothetical protein
MASYNNQTDGGNPEQDHHLQTMFARLQAARNAQHDDSAATHDLLSRFTSYNQGNNNRGFYNQGAADSPMINNDDLFPPPAPTPPSNFTRTHQHPGRSNLGPIGSGPSSGSANNGDQSNNLLNLLKFSGSSGGSVGSGSITGSQNLQPVPQTSPPGPSQSATYESALGAPHPTAAPQLHAPVPMPADPQGLLATLIQGNLHSEASAPEPPPANKPPAWASTAPMEDTQSYLLSLLNRPKPQQRDKASTIESSKLSAPSPPSASESGAVHSKFGHQDHVESPSNQYEYTSPASQPRDSRRESSRKPTKFDYSNPFEDLAAASSPQNRTPKSSTPGTSAPVDPPATHSSSAATVHVYKKHTSATSSPKALHDHKSVASQRGHITSPEYGSRDGDEASHVVQEHGREFSPASGFHDRRKETVSEAMNDLAETASKEAQEALDRATQDQAHAKIVDELDDMMRAQTDAEFHEMAGTVAKDIKQALDREENEHVLEDQYAPETARAIRDIVDDAANGHVADSWESAEADEIVVIEEDQKPVRVYNFPMKPWISITITDNEEPRPLFRDDVVLDIARLKKEFDQVDRNLVTASESYIVYGMSKAGGLRVIRQHDGRDAKLFTDTKDRIFNVAMSSTPSDLPTPLQESIIGTGVSGTVYYVLIKDGDKSHLDDPHPEQYGFALPPNSSQDGDAPGGVLKTRAKTSSTHPEYFAVGRGKTISIIWPAYIIQNNLFKPGHDRVVDTEKLSKQCALKINTGKAGKDFTFSQDDTTIVSLDKSGRVKFWDVRDLTAAAEDAGSTLPMPAHTALEVKEPLMTLSTTPEGEKAWPTSVLLLDKQRPYQKRCALRYMIVGMKQNHTLQLWDLALGKPVQEFHLPHSKEQDAVCSVTYHPPSGMIVVGHPTRNSIYFLHLSAPKYTIKGLSQVDYVQKLVAKDSSIPEPDSTAVISGVREYSFSNKGLLRSLDILVNPAASSDREDEPTLFELYAMHSKGVTGIWIKQGELGWTKDNKVIEGVDAADAGLVKISKLKELPSAVVVEQPPADEPTGLPIRIAHRSSNKETPPPQSTSAPSHEQPKKVATNSMPSNLQPERKDEQAPVTPNNQSDKSEKKARKKREKAAAAAADKSTADNTQPNGTSHSPHVGPVSTKGVDQKSTWSAAQPAMTAESIQAAVKQIEGGLKSSLSTIITSELKEHRGKMEAEFHSREESFNTSQQNLLNMVSSILNDNVERVLIGIVKDQFETTVVPSLSGVITKTISDQLDGKIGGRISHSVQNQMQKLLPNAVSQALQKPELASAVTEKVVSGVALDMETNFRETLMSTITPIFSDMALAAARSVTQDVQHRTAEQLEEYQLRHVADSKKIDQLTGLVTTLADRLSGMEAAQADFQDTLLRIQQQGARDQYPVPQTQATAVQSQPPTSHSQHSSHKQSYDSPVPNTSNQLVPFSDENTNSDPQLQHLIASIASHMERGDFETGLVRWLQGDHKQEIFDQYISKFNPNFLRELKALVLLSVGAVVSEQLVGPLTRRKIGWMEVIIHSMHSSMSNLDPQVRDVVPSIMEQFRARLDELMLRINANAPHDPVLHHISQMAHMATTIRDEVRHAEY